MSNIIFEDLAKVFAKDSHKKVLESHNGDIEITEHIDAYGEKTYHLYVDIKGQPEINGKEFPSLELAKSFLKTKVKDVEEDRDKVMGAIVDKVMKIYMKQDYDYAEEQIKKGIKLRKIDIPDEIEFLKRNKLVNGLSNPEIFKVAKTIVNLINGLHSKTKVKDVSRISSSALASVDGKEYCAIVQYYEKFAEGITGANRSLTLYLKTPISGWKSKGEARAAMEAKGYKNYTKKGRDTQFGTSIGETQQTVKIVKVSEAGSLMSSSVYKRFASYAVLDSKAKDAVSFPMVKKMRQENYALELTINPINGSEDNGFSGVALVRDRDDIKGAVIARKGFSGWTPGQVSGNAKKWFIDFVKE